MYALLTITSHLSSAEDKHEQAQEITLTYGKSVDWYEGEKPPKLYSGYLKVTDKGYAFLTRSNETGSPKTFSIEFYDEDAEVEARTIAEAHQNLPENIQLLGYVRDNNPSKIDIVYGLKIGQPLVSPNKE